MASLTRAKRVVSTGFGLDALLVGAGYSGARLLTEVIRSEVVDFQFPLANAAYALVLAGGTYGLSRRREARMLALGMLASGLSTAWSDFAR